MWDLFEAVEDRWVIHGGGHNRRIQAESVPLVSRMAILLGAGIRSTFVTVPCSVKKSDLST